MARSIRAEFPGAFYHVMRKRMCQDLHTDPEFPIPNRVVTHAIENYILGAKKSLTISPEFNLSKGGTNLKKGKQ
jgi:hypothetical protein